MKSARSSERLTLERTKEVVDETNAVSERSEEAEECQYVL